MAKIIRTIVHKTVFSGYANSNPSDITEYNEESRKYSMDLDKFIKSAEVEE